MHPNYGHRLVLYFCLTSSIYPNVSLALLWTLLPHQTLTTGLHWTGPTVLALDSPDQYNNKHGCKNAHKGKLSSVCQTGQGHWTLFQNGHDHLQRKHNLHPPWHRNKTKQNRAPTPPELKTFIWQHQLTPDTHTELAWPCSTSRLIKIVAGIRGVGTTARESHSFCVLCVFLSVCMCSGVHETRQRLREGRSGEALTLSILCYWLVSRETVPSGQRQIE